MKTMNKHIKVFYPLAILLLGLTLAGCGDELSESEKQSLISSGGGGCTYTSATPLTTIYFSNTAGEGNMFDIVAGAQDVRIDSLDGHDIFAAGTPGDWAIYYKAGSYVGFNADLPAWTLAGSGTATSAGTGTGTALPAMAGVTIPAGQTYGFYVTKTNGSNIGITNGSVEGSVYVGDGNIDVLEGIFTAYPFAGSAATFIFNGTIHYSTCV